MTNITATTNIREVRILLLEDSPRDAALCKSILERAGYKVQTHVVATAEEFVTALRFGTYDIVLADYLLPNWSGMDALEAIRQQPHEIPFILLTGTVGEEVAVDCIKKGATDYILKDRIARLPFAVERALNESLAREEHKKTERTRDLLVSMVELSDDAIVGIGADGAVLTWNRGATRIFEYTTGQIEGKSIKLLFAPECHGALQDGLAALRRGQGVARYETQGRTSSGNSIEIAVSMSPIPASNEGVKRASVVIRDITDQKKLQKQFFLAQKMEAVGRLAAGVAHDFNNLLTVINGYSSLLAGQLKEEDPFHSEVTEIQKAGERAASLTRQLLAFSRKQVLQARVLDLNAIVADIDRMIRRLIGEDISLTTRLEPQLGSVKADPGQIEQVVMNIAVNARDAMPNGGTLIIETANVDLEQSVTWRDAQVAAGRYVALTITDTGIGMDAETEARIFEPFFTTKSQGEGTGLGLSTVYGIVAQSGGAITVYSEVGKGATFKIYLPRVQEDPERVEAPVPVEHQGGSETILVVEDEDAVRNLVCSILENHGYTVIRAKNGGEGLLVCEQYEGKIDLLVSDVIMPLMSGGELAERLKSLRPGMKVLFMSGYTGAAMIRQGGLLPGAGFLEKPFPPEVLIRRVREIIEAA